mmetsp:Transcript_28910/g.27833  ORF Transcript_28910/g.27833 Transcript_28910/m.27833 type:complete len:248 (-) Transcript_28910:127-870(-)
MHLIESGDFDGVHEAFDAQLGDLGVIRLLQEHTEDRQVGAPGVLKHRPDRLRVIHQKKLRVLRLVFFDDGCTALDVALALLEEDFVLALGGFGGLSLQLDPSVVVLHQGEGLLLNVVVDPLQEVIRQVPAIVNSLCHLDEIFHRHSTLDGLRVVQGGLQHHHRIRQQVDALRGPKRVGVIFAELFSELLHDSVDFLAFSWNPEARQHLLHGLNVGDVHKVVGVYVGVEDHLVDLHVFPQVVPNHGLA